MKSKEEIIQMLEEVKIFTNRCGQYELDIINQVIFFLKSEVNTFGVKDIEEAFLEGFKNANRGNAIKCEDYIKQKYLKKNY